MRGFTRQLTIDATPAKVFGVLTNLDDAPKWMPAIQKTEFVEGTSVAPGAKWTEWRLNGKRTMKATINVAKFERDQALDLHVSGGPFTMDLGFALVKEGKGTRVDYHCYGQGKGLMRLMTGMIMKQVEKQDDDLLARLKAFAESTGPKDTKAAKPKPSKKK